MRSSLNSRRGEARLSRAVDIGREGYVQSCSACHGEGGRVDGPAAPRLTADLTTHVPLHRDGDLFTFMRDGISGTPAPPHRGVPMRNRDCS